MCSVKFGDEAEHELPTAEVGPDPSSGRRSGSGRDRVCSLRLGAGPAIRRMGARRQ